MSSLLLLGAGYLGAAVAERALQAGHSVVLADNWTATDEAQLEPLRTAGADVRTADIRDVEHVDALVSQHPDRVVLTAAQASRPLSDADPDYTEETNVLGVRRVAQAVGAHGVRCLVFASSLQVYGRRPQGEVGPDHPYGPQGDLSHLSKVYGELCLRMYAERHGFGLALLRLGIVYGPGPVMHDRPESITVVDAFRRRAAAGEALRIDDPSVAIGVVHLDDAARITAECAPAPGELVVANVAAETVTVGDVAALATGAAPSGDAGAGYASPFTYEHGVAEYLAA